MRKFEYKMVRQERLAEMENFLIFLNGLGQKGWELCGIDYDCLIFKREVIDG